MRVPRKLEHHEIAHKLTAWRAKDEFWHLRAAIYPKYSTAKKAHIKKILMHVDDYQEFTPDEMQVIEEELTEIDRFLKSRCLPSFLSVHFCEAIQGRGLFAAEEISEGSLIGLYTGFVMDDEDTEEANRYLFGIGEGYSINALNCGNYTRAINNTTPRYANVTANKIMLPGNPIPQIAFISHKKIKKGHQVLFSYGSQYFKALNMKPLVLKPDAC